MDRLKKVIGPAPSEDPEGFSRRLAVERERVTAGLQAIRDRRTAGKVTKTKSRKAKEKESISLLSGIDDLDAFIKFVNERKDNQ